jgi:hypothetical protein
MPTAFQSTSNRSTNERPKVSAMSEVTPAEKALALPGVNSSPRYRSWGSRSSVWAMPPQCGQAVRHGQHDHMIIGRNEIGVQHMIRVFAQELGVALG